MEIIKINAELRDSRGTSGAKKVRNNNLIPCIMYGGDEQYKFAVKPLDVRGLVYTHEFKTVELKLGDKVTNAILKDVQFHPISDSILHLDFQELVPDKKVKVSVPVSFTGAAPGVKEGGTKVALLRKISIKATPDNLVDTIVGDISNLELGASLAVKELKIPEGIEVLENENTPVLFIETPRSLKSLESVGDLLEEGEEEGAEAAEAPAE